ncbi:MAG: hypothetical protein KF729_26485 [Sandaracinaceae bacterium]|nr:hypothetical protein [Sandaracinaceae bacterium]
MGFRSDLEALAHKVRSLEAELEELRGAEGEDVRAEIDALRAEIAALHAETQRDERALRETLARIDAVRARVAPGEAPADPPAAPESVPSVAQPGPTEAPGASGAGCFAALALVSIIGIGAYVASSAHEPSVWRSEARAPDVPDPIRSGVDDLTRPIATRPIDALPGAPHAVDPMEVLEAAREVSGLGPDAQLVSIEASYVGVDGRVDLDAATYRGSVRYRFGVPRASTGQSAQAPLGAPRVRAPNADAASVELNARGMQGPLRVLARAPSTVRFVPLPRCSFADVWALASARGAPRPAVAAVTYHAALDGAPVWSFRIADTDVALSFGDAECVAAGAPSEAP